MISVTAKLKTSIHQYPVIVKKLILAQFCREVASVCKTIEEMRDDTKYQILTDHETSRSNCLSSKYSLDIQKNRIPNIHSRENDSL